VRAEVEVELCRVRDSNINSRSGRNVAGLAGLLLLVGAEEPGENPSGVRVAVLISLMVPRPFV
jgi:hypothetical protein